MLGRLACVGVLALGLGGCEIFDDDDDDVVLIGESLVRFFHAVPDAPAVDANAGGAPLFQDVPFKSGTAFAVVDEGTVDVSVDALTAGGAATVFGPQDLALAADTEYTVVAIGTVGTTIDALVLENPTTDVGAGNVRLQVVHSAASAPTVDVYVTAPGADLNAEAPVTSFSFGEFTGQVEVPEGDYQIRVTLQNDPNTVVFDAGTLTLPAGLDLTLFAVDRTGVVPGAPISLAVLDASATLPQFEILDVNDPTGVRVVHLSPDAPPVDVVVDDDFAAPVIEALAYPDASPVLELPVPAGDEAITVNVKVTPFDNPGVIVNNNGLGDDVTLERGELYTVLATGELADFQLLPLEDEDRSVATDARVRIVHGSPNAGNVDIYVTAPGADISAETPAFTDVPFRAVTDYVPLVPGAYDVTVTATGTTTAAIGPVAVSFVGGDVATVIARDAPGGGGPFALEVLSDFAFPQ
jgi:hypothetical protein